MDEIRDVCLAILAAIVIGFVFFAAMDREVARTDYLENVKQCKPIHGCLFGWNCRHYNKMIEKECE